MTAILTSTDPGLFARSRSERPGGPPRSQLVRVGELDAVLALTGRLPRTWAGSLASGLAAHGVSLVRGCARESDADRWSARLSLDLGFEQNASLDFLALTREPRAAARALPRLLDFEIESGGGDGMRVEVHAWDGVGLLAAVLERVAAAGLRPTEIHLDTAGELAFHALHLRDRDGTAPSSDRVGALENALTRLLTRS